MLHHMNCNYIGPAMFSASLGNSRREVREITSERKQCVIAALKMEVPLEPEKEPQQTAAKEIRASLWQLQLNSANNLNELVSGFFQTTHGFQLCETQSREPS